MNGERESIPFDSMSAMVCALHLEWRKDVETVAFEGLSRNRIRQSSQCAAVQLPPHTCSHPASNQSCSKACAPLLARATLWASNER